MNNLIKFFINNHKLTIILSLMLVAFGIMGIKKLNSESFPNVNFAMATITTRYDGATARDVETKITKPIEDKIREISGLKDVRSVSKSGLSSIIVRVDMDNEDEDEVLEELQKAIKAVNNLPPDLRDDPVYLEINSEEIPAIELAITGDNTNRARDLMVRALKEELEDDKKIKNVRLTGYTKRQFNIRIDKGKLEKHHIGIEEVLGKIKQRNIDVAGGNLRKDGIKKIIRVAGKVNSAGELGDLVIRSNFSGRKILLKDVALVSDGAEDPVVLTLYNGEEATFLVVTKKAGSDTLALVDGVDIVLKKFHEKYDGQFKINIYNNEANRVRKKLSILSSNAISGLILVVVFLFLFLPGKIGLVASISLPLAVMATMGFMPILGMNLDAITILALVIALGMLVDNSVVISENFARLRDDEGMSAHDAAYLSAQQLWLPITTTGFTTIAAFLPMLVTTGIMGQFIKYIPIIVTIAILISLFESFFFLPMRLRFAGEESESQKLKPKKDWFQFFIKRFEHFMNYCVSYRYKVMFGFMGIIIGSFLLMGIGNKFILFPADQTEIYIARLEMPRGTTLEKTKEELKIIYHGLNNALNSGAEKLANRIVLRAGISNAGPMDAKGGKGDNHGLIVIYASEFAKYNVNYTEFLKTVRTVTSKDVEDLTYEAQAMGPPVGEPINATFRSNNLEQLEQLTNLIKEDMSKIDGVLDMKTDDIMSEDEIKVLIDYEKADQLGLSVNAIGSAIRTALSGTMISKVTLDNKEIDLNVRYTDDLRSEVSDISSVKVMDSRGNLLPVSQIAKTEIYTGARELKRFDFKSSKTLTGNIDENKITSVLANLELVKIFEKYSKDFKDVSIVFGGEGESTKESMESLGQAMMMALMGIFALLVFLFKSYLRPLIIMSTIPLGLLGFSVAFFFHGRPISFMAMIGVIGLAGIIVNSGIVLISFIDQMRDEGKMQLDQILVKASGMRLRAVLVTSLTTISGLIPTAYGIGGSDAMLVPMTLAMAWGLTSGTILTLIWVPCAYAILEDWNKALERVLTQVRGQK